MIAGRTFEELLLGLGFQEITCQMEGMKALSGFDLVVQDERPLYAWANFLNLSFVMDTPTGRVWVSEGRFIFRHRVRDISHEVAMKSAQGRPKK